MNEVTPARATPIRALNPVPFNGDCSACVTEQMRTIVRAGEHARLDNRSSLSQLHCDVCGSQIATALAERVPGASTTRPRFDPARKLFAQNCASGHGDSGGGDGPAAAAPAPTNSTFSNRRSILRRQIGVEDVERL